MSRDLISEMLTHIRNGAKACHRYVDVPFSKLNENILKTLLAKGFIKSYVVASERYIIRVYLAYVDNTKSMISALDRVSRPGRRMYVRKDRVNKIMNGYGCFIISTSQGVFDDAEVRKRGLGGEILCSVY